MGAINDQVRTDRGTVRDVSEGRDESLADISATKLLGKDLPSSPSDGELLRFNGSSGAWEHKFSTSGVFNVKDFGAVGDGSTDDTAAIQAAIDAAPKGGLVYFPEGDFVFSTITVDKSLTLMGGGFEARSQDGFGNANWDAGSSFIGGTILRSTATSGDAVDIGPTAQRSQVNLRDLLVVGPGSGTSTGIHVGTDTATITDSVWSHVQVSNFHRGVDLNQAQDNQFNTLKAVGCEEGIRVADNQNVFVNQICQVCSDYGTAFSGGSGNVIYGGLQQAHPSGCIPVKLGDATGGATENTVAAVWFESADFVASDRHIVIDSTGGSAGRNVVRDNRFTRGSGSVDIEVIDGAGGNPSNNAFLFNESKAPSAEILVASGAGALCIYNNLAVNDGGSGSVREIASDTGDASLQIGGGDYLEITPGIHSQVDLTLQNDRSIGWKDTGGTVRRAARLDGGNNMKLGGTGINKVVPDSDLQVNGNVGFFFTVPVAQQSALTAADTSTVDDTYGTEEQNVIENLRTRVNELEAALQAYGLLP